MAGKSQETTHSVQSEQRAWAEKLITWTGLKPSPLAVRAGLADTTLTRLFDPSYRGTLRPHTIKALTKEYGVPGPDEYADGALFPGEEAEPFDPKSGGPELARLVKAIVAEQPGFEAWRLLGNVLIAAGYLPGDILIVDMTAIASEQDAVCAEAPKADGAAPTRALIWRVYKPPFLESGALDRFAQRTLFVDGHTVAIKGVVQRMIRPHSLSTARGKFPRFGR